MIASIFNTLLRIMLWFWIRYGVRARFRVRIRLNIIFSTCCLGLRIQKPIRTTIKLPINYILETIINKKNGRTDKKK